MSEVTGAGAIRVPDRLPVLGGGSHPPGSAELCAMEAAAWLAGETWSDHPRTVHPAVAAVARWVNDKVSDAERQGLWPLIVASVDTHRPRHPLLAVRLRLAAGRAMYRASASGDHAQAWRDVLDRHRRWTRGRRPAAAPISVEVSEVLAARPGSADPRGPVEPVESGREGVASLGER